MDLHKYDRYQDTPTSPVTNELINWPKQHHHSPSPKAPNRHWRTYEESQDRSRKKHSRRGGPLPPLSSTRDSISRRPQAARRSCRSRAQPCTICWQQGHFMGTSPHITRDSTIAMHAWSARATDSKHRTTSSTAERYRRAIG
jgi:hypothetical protein